MTTTTPPPAKTLIWWGQYFANTTTYPPPVVNKDGFLEYDNHQIRVNAALLSADKITFDVASPHWSASVLSLPCKYYRVYYTGDLPQGIMAVQEPTLKPNYFWIGCILVVIMVLLSWLLFKHSGAIWFLTILGTIIFIACIILTAYWGKKNNTTLNSGCQDNLVIHK
jgi:hypothetical protein